jgi:hypothetical protein
LVAFLVVFLVVFFLVGIDYPLCEG